MPFQGLRERAAAVNTTFALFYGGTEDFACEHADQWRGCLACKKSHHVSSFCPNCGECFFVQRYNHDNVVGTIVYCACGKIHLWD